MSGRRRRSESLWDRKEDAVPQNEIKEFHSGGGSPKRSISEVNDVLMSDDFNENLLMDNDNNSDRHRMKSDPAFDEWENRYTSRPSDNSYDQPYRGRARGVGVRDRNRSRSRSWSPHRTRDADRERGGTRGLPRSRSRSRSRDRGGRARSPSRSSSNPQTKGSDGYRKDTARNEEARDYHRSHRSGYDDQDHRRQSNQIVRQPCRFFSMGRCNRSNCKFSHDLPKSVGYEGRSRDNDTALTGHHPPQDHDFPNNFDDNNKSSWNDDHPSWNNLDSGVPYNVGLASNQESHIPDNQMFHSYEPFTQDVHNMASQFPSDLNGNGSNLQLNVPAQATFLLPDKGGKPLETSKNSIPQVVHETTASNEQVTQVSSLPQNLNIADALGLLYSLPKSATSGGPVASMKVVNESVKTSVPVENQTSKERVGNQEVNENKIAEKPKNEEDSTNLGKSEVEGKVEEGNIGNDEKAMRQFKIALVEFVKELLKPTWKEGKMSREVYKTIVKKVVEKVTSTIQGVQIPRTQEKIDQYLAFSKSKISKLVEAYVGRLVKA